MRIFGVSVDTVKAQSAFKKKYDLPFTLLSDTDFWLCRSFGVPLRMYKFATRQAYLFKDGKLIWRDLRASTDEQASDVLAVLHERSLKAG